MKRVVITGMAGISPLGSTWPEVRTKLQSLTNGVRRMDDWSSIQGLNTILGAPIPTFDLPTERYTTKKTRAMGRVALLGVRATELALEDAGLLGAPVLESGECGVAYGSCSGDAAAVGEVASMMRDSSTYGLNATTYVRMMSHTAAVMISVFFRTQGRVITSSSACTSSSQGIGYAYEAIKAGHQTLMLAGGCEALHPSVAAIFDTLFAASTKNDAPEFTPRPFDRDRDGLVIGEGACTFVLEEFEHAKARGARIYAEILGYGTNSDGRHVTHPSSRTMKRAMELALQDAKIPPSAVGYVNGHGTATDTGDIAESQATAELFGAKTPFSTLKSYMGHTMGACGALEAWMTLMMLREGWIAPTINLSNPDSRCHDLDYVMGGVRKLDTEIAMSNNFAFGGINTSIVFRRWA